MVTDERSAMAAKGFVITGMAGWCFPSNPSPRLDFPVFVTSNNQDLWIKIF